MVIKLTKIFLIVGLLGACSQPSNGEDYLTRLSRVLKVEFDADEFKQRVSARQSVLVLPPAKERLALKPLELNLGVREFLSFKQCRLHGVLAQRNSQLGRVAPASQVLISDLEIIATIPSCVELIKSESPALAKKLVAMQEQKERHLAQSFAAAVIGGPEFTEFWRLWTPTSSAVGLNLSSIESFTYFTHLWNAEVSEKDLEAQLEALRTSEGGAMLAKATELNVVFEYADQFIEQRLQQPLCLGPSPTPAAHIFANVVQNVFIAKLQLEAVALERSHQKLLPIIAELEANWRASLSAEYIHWVQARDRELMTIKTGIKRHSQKIAALFQQCGLRPGVR